MRSVTIPRVMVLLMTAMLVVPLTVTAQEVYVPPVTPEAEQVASLFNITTWIAIVVFIITEVALFYTIWRFRKNRTVPSDEEHRGHTTAEITWTVIPALILIFIGVLAVNTLQTIEAIPEEREGDAIDVRVEAGRFAFTYYYPDGSFDDTLNVKTGETVRLLITAVDNQHAFWIPAFAIKIDAYPGRVNEAWFTAPEPGEYFVQCAEYCGSGHHAMHSNVIVYGEDEFDGAPFTVIEDAARDVPPGPEFDAVLLEEPGDTPGMWTIDPAEITITVAEGEGLHMWAPNAEQNGGPHNMTIGLVGSDDGIVYNGGAYPPGEGKWLNFTLEDLGGPGEYEYWCAVPGHKGLGMFGRITIELEE